MERRKLGDTGLLVPVVGMGTWQTFDVNDAGGEANCKTIVDIALENEANLFDSSPMYGEAERVLGAALTGRREKAIIATKVWHRSLDKGREQIEQALEWFGGYVDIYQIHNLVGWQQYLPLLEDLKQQGKIGIIGATHYNPNSFEELMQVMDTGRIQQIQIPYNPLEKQVERKVLPLAEETGIGVLAMRPLGGGDLVRRPPAPASLKPLEKYGIKTWSQALLKWCVSDTRIHCAIPATSRPNRMHDNALAGDTPWLDPEARAYISKLATEG